MTTFAANTNADLIVIDLFKDVPLLPSKLKEILKRYHSENEIEFLRSTVAKEDVLHQEFVKTNKFLSEYFATRDNRLTEV